MSAGSTWLIRSLAVITLIKNLGRDTYLARQLSVRKVVPTLTSRCVEIYLSMAGAKQLVTRYFYPGSGRGRTSSRGVLGALYCVALWCLQRGATSKAREEAGPPGPIGTDCGKCQYRGEGRKRASECSLSSPLQLGDCPSFYRPRKSQFTGVPHYSSYVWRYGVQCRGVDGRPNESHFLRDVMAPPLSVQERLRGWRHRGFLFGRRPYISSRVRLTGGCRAYSNWRGGILSLCTPTT
jgi:hypothetical protein